MPIAKHLLVLLVTGGAALAADPQPAPTPTSGPVATYLGDAKYQPTEPAARGKDHKQAGARVQYERFPVVWAWRLTLADGRGLGFGGISPRTDDPRPETEVLLNGTWTPIHADLRKRNPVQSLSDRLAALRRPLQRLTQAGRHGWLEGLDAQAEGKLLTSTVLPLVKEFSGQLDAVIRDLAAVKGADAYVAGQIAFARKHLEPLKPALAGIAPGLGGAQFDALRQARIHLEIAADALDAAPSARALSPIAYDAASGLFVVVGGDHFDYLGNDVWVFDPRDQRWRQRHPAIAPEPRAMHHFEAGAAGKLVLKGGYIYGRRDQPGWDKGATYVHAGPDEWVYDVAADAWSAPAGAPTFPSDTRHFREGACVPDHFTSGNRPDPAAHAKRLAELPANTWVPLKPEKGFAWNRDWGTVAYDPDRDMLYWYSGGHSAYPGTDVAQYHMATNTWDQTVEMELPPGFIGTNEPMVAQSFNRRPWLAHQYRSLAYHPGLKLMLNNGRFATNPPIDKFCYFYDPDLGDWAMRKPTPILFNRHHAQMMFTKEAGMLTWQGGAMYRLDDASLEWKQMEVKGQLRGTTVDNAGSLYDDRRGRALFFAGTGYGKPYDGEVFALDIASGTATSFKPEGSELLPQVSKNMWAERETVRLPECDLFLIGKDALPDGRFLVLDPAKNRWLGLRLAGDFPKNTVNNGLTYDRKRKLVYMARASGEVFALRIDAKTLDLVPLSELAAAMPPPAKPAAK